MHHFYKEEDMTEQEQPNGAQVEKAKKGFSGMLITILLMCMLIVIIISNLWTIKLSSQVSSLSSELKTLRTHNYRLNLVEDKLAKMEIQNRLQAIENSIGGISKLVEVFKQVDAAKANELQGVITDLQTEKELLQKQMDNYRQAAKKSLEGSQNIPRLQAITESEQPAVEKESSYTQKISQNWWEKIINFRLFHGRK
jgi:DNA-binding transcriptional MerR regulator